MCCTSGPEVHTKATGLVEVQPTSLKQHLAMLRSGAGGPSGKSSMCSSCGPFMCHAKCCGIRLPEGLLFFSFPSTQGWKEYRNLANPGPDVDHFMEQLEKQAKLKSARLSTASGSYHQSTPKYSL
mmetsp:Transcript_39181/g.85244  ORF Transcript_39181/g.85244 Transcript_39181/m.85244 type:complete len:125 (-) Transcript_39181:263-637(-)|eukprot:CAMPEP_0118927744 /NCGR_PEP_ID=MMETSP1169-20130426/5159_1 /TAXON_ID=36882 /ORGANISM="Pyramimonas obovata, Strain CCMP722" /LENGTH=124 /DNA_ID=CAMNT_0006869577 /DNA_START=1165 /DNA_END=1539 /DNA_ORIENTATION=-